MSVQWASAVYGSAWLALALAWRFNDHGLVTLVLIGAAIALVMAGPAFFVFAVRQARARGRHVRQSR